MPAEPDRHLAGFRARVDAGIVNRVPLAFDADMRLGPQLLHDLDLLFRAAATIVEVLIETDEFDLVPSHPDAEPETAAAQHVETGGLLRYQHGLALRQDQHASRETELRAHPGEIAEQNEWIVIKAVGNTFASGSARRVLPHHMVGRLYE